MYMSNIAKKTLATIHMGEMSKTWKTYITDDDVTTMIEHEMGLMFIHTIDNKDVRINLTKIDYIEYEEVK